MGKTGMTGRQLRNGTSARTIATARQAWPGATLTDRELEVCRRMVKNDEPTGQVAARDLGIKEETLRHHLTRIYRKLGVRTRLGMYRMLAEHYKINMGRWDL